MIFELYTKRLIITYYNTTRNTMPNYTNSKIYAIRSHHTDQIYVGSTTQKLSNRMTNHRSCYNKYVASNKKYVSSFEILRHGDAYIELIENIECLCQEQLRQREGELIREMNCVNKNIAGRSKKQYLQDNKEQIKEQSKHYYQNNKEQIKQYYQDNKEQIKQYYQDNKEQISHNKKQYYQINKDQIKRNVKQYRQNNKERVSVKTDCPCGGKYQRRNRTRHFRTKKHRNYEAQLPR